AVLRMHRLDKVTHRPQRLDRIAAAVEDHVRRIEVDPQIWPVHVLNKTKKYGGRFLTRLEREGLPVARRVVADAADDITNTRVIRVSRIFGHAADVASDARDVHHFGKVAQLDRAALARVARRGRNEADGALDSRDIRI